MRYKQIVLSMGVFDQPEGYGVGYYFSVLTSNKFVWVRVGMTRETALAFLAECGAKTGLDLVPGVVAWEWVVPDA